MLGKIELRIAPKVCAVSNKISRSYVKGKGKSKGNPFMPLEAHGDMLLVLDYDLIINATSQL